MVAWPLIVLLSAVPKSVVSTTPPPVLVMVRTPGNASFEKSQQRLHEELTLLLDSFMVILTSTDAKDFARRPLADQISTVLPLSKANDAVAVVWLAEPLPGQMMLHLLAMGTGRTLVRTLEFDRKSQSENVLALMLRELLGTAFLYEPAPAVPNAVRSVVTQVRRTMPFIDEPMPVQTATVISPQATTSWGRCEWCLRVAGGAMIEAGLTEPVGPTARYGVSTNVTVRLDPFDFGLAVDVVGFGSKVSAFHLTSTSMPLLATAAWRALRTPNIQAGPVLGAGGELSWTTITSPATTSSALFTAGPAGFVGCEAQLALGLVSVWGRLDVLLRSRRPQLTETTEHDPVWKLSSATLRLSLGLAWEGF